MLGLLDYIIFGITLFIVCAISFYFGCFGTKQKTATEYLYGSKKLKSIPIGLSLLGCCVSANPIIGTIAEVYIFGTQFLMNILSLFISMFFIYIFIIPVFCANLKLKVPYEYFELRFNKHTRLLISIIYIIQIIIHPSVVLYTAGITLSEFTGLSLLTSCIIIGIICTTYTVTGGFNGVIWTDVFQIGLIASSLIFTLYRGLDSAGGFASVWQIANEGDRLQFFNMDPNPFIRLSFWSVILGMSVINIAHSAGSSSAIQRYLALSNIKDAKLSTLLFNIGLLGINVITGIISLCIYAVYHNCDPLKTGKISNPSQLLSYFINDLPADSFGFRGIFTTGILSAGLSTLSAEMNSVSGLIYYDILEKYFKIQHNEVKSTVIMKIVVVIYGTLHIIIAPLIQHFKYFMQFILSFLSCTYGPKTGVIFLATAFPKSNSWGAMVGLISGIFTVVWININAMFYNLSSEYMLPTSTDNCTSNFTIIVKNATKHTKDDVPLIYQLSYMYYSVLGMIITIVVGLLVSYLTGQNDVNKMDVRLIAPCVRPKFDVVSKETTNTENNCSDI